MIAQPRRNEPIEESTSLLDYSSNLFAGLTFPEVPKFDPKGAQRKVQQVQQQSLIDQFEDDIVSGLSCYLHVLFPFISNKTL